MSRERQRLRPFVVAVGGLSITVGLVLLQVNLLLAELALLTGVNFSADGEPVNYTAPWFLFVVPVLLLVAGGIAVVAGATARFGGTATDGAASHEMQKTPQV